MASEEPDQHWEYWLRKYLLLLATLVATVTYTAGFSPPGGVWQDTGDDHLAGDPIIRDTHYGRYLVFFYCNATAFASSLMVIVLILLLAVVHERQDSWITIKSILPLRVVMVADLLGLMGAYAAGTCRDAPTTIYCSLLVIVVFAYLVVHTVLASLLPDENNHDGDDKRPRKVLMLLATFAISVTYVSGLSTPGGFWDGTQVGHRAGDAILQDYNPARLMVFFVCNTTAFGASLLIVLLLLDKNLHVETASLRTVILYGRIVVALVGLVAAYAAGSCREAETTVCVVGPVVAVLSVLGCIMFQVAALERRLMEAIKICQKKMEAIKNNLWARIHARWQAVPRIPCFRQQAPASQANSVREEQHNQSLEKARPLVLLLATLATSVTYQAGLHPPGGLWQDNGDGHTAGDPILLTTNPRRYKAFYYCNSTAFMASLVAIVLVRKRSVLKRHTLEAAMILVLFGLIGGYAAGSCRDVSTSIYVVALAGAVLVYVIIHVVFFTLDHNESSDEEKVEKRRKRLLLFAILAATITYQAGLTPPSGFWSEDDELGHRAGEPVLFSNYPRRYNAFFYSNSVSFMSSIAHIILLVNPNLYRPAIRSYALSVCTAAGLFGLIGAYAAGSTQHLKTSIYIFVLAALVALLLIVFTVKKLEKAKNANTNGNTDADETRVEAGGRDPRSSDAAVELSDEAGKEKQAKCKYLMLLGILVASITYQAGLDPPGGLWQGDVDGHTAGNPVLQSNRRLRYLFFFHCNSTSFVASIVVVILLLPKWLKEKEWWLRVMDAMIVLDLLGLLGAHAAGSSRKWETSGYVVAFIIAVLAFVAVHALMSCCSGTSGRANSGQQPPEPQLQEGNDGHLSLGSSV